MSVPLDATSPAGPVRPAPSISSGTHADPRPEGAHRSEPSEPYVVEVHRSREEAAPREPASVALDELTNITQQQIAGGQGLSILLLEEAVASTGELLDE